LLFDGVGNLKDIEQSPVIGVSSQAPALPHAAVVDSTLEPFSVMDTPPLNELSKSGVTGTKIKFDLEKNSLPINIVKPVTQMQITISEIPSNAIYQITISSGD
jgi:hypothetical protein